MIETTLDPFTHALKQGRDFTLDFLFTGEDVQVGDRARMEVRRDLMDAAPLDTLTTENSRITLSAEGDGVRLVATLPGEVTRLYPIQDANGTPYYRKLRRGEYPEGTDPDALKAMRVLALYTTLFITDAAGTDRHVSGLDLCLLMEATYTRGGTE